MIWKPHHPVDAPTGAADKQKTRRAMACGPAGTAWKCERVAASTRTFAGNRCLCTNNPPRCSAAIRGCGMTRGLRPRAKGRCCLHRLINCRFGSLRTMVAEPDGNPRSSEKKVSKSQAHVKGKIKKCSLRHMRGTKFSTPSDLSTSCTACASRGHFFRDLLQSAGAQQAGGFLRQPLDRGGASEFLLRRLDGQLGPYH